MKIYIQLGVKRLKRVFNLMLLLLFCLLTSLSCLEEFPPFFNLYIILKNNSNDTLNYYFVDGEFSFDSKIKNEAQNVYPDTILTLNDDILCHNKLNPGLQDKFYGYNGRLNPNFIISVFIIHHDTLQLYRYENVARQNKILIRYDLTKQDIDKLERVIPYPPTEEMKDMHMSPSYSEFMKRYKFN